MIVEGLYDVDFRAVQGAHGGRDGEPVDLGSGLAVLRSGRILGTDRRGSVFMGRYEYDRVSATAKVSVSMQVPPEAELVTGFAAGADGATIEIVADIAKPAPKVETTVDVAGRPVAVRLTYVGPLPN